MPVTRCFEGVHAPWGPRPVVAPRLGTGWAQTALAAATVAASTALGSSRGPVSGAVGVAAGLAVVVALTRWNHGRETVVLDPTGADLDAAARLHSARHVTVLVDDGSGSPRPVPTVGCARREARRAGVLV